MEISSIEEQMTRVIENLENRFAEVRAGRANPQILNKIMVDYYGVPTPINQVASISVPEARLIVVQPWDRSMLNPVYKEIEKAELGIHPINDGQVIRLVFPELTEERRNELAKDINRMAEEAKIQIRNIRRDEMDKAKAELKANTISQDEERSQEDQIQKVTDKYVAKIDEVTDKKEQDILKV